MRDLINLVENAQHEVNESVHGLAPDVGTTFEYDQWAGSHASKVDSYRVTGWLKNAPPPAPMPELTKANAHEIIKHILDSGNREFDAGKGKTRLVHCTRADAEYVTGAGVSGCIAPIDKIKVTGRVPWSQDAIDDARAQAMAFVGQMVF